MKLLINYLLEIIFKTKYEWTIHYYLLKLQKIDFFQNRIIIEEN